MTKKLSPSQVEKYDVSQKIIRELANLESRTILFSIKQKSKNAEEISDETKIPIASVYKHLHILEALALIFVERLEFSYNGRRMKFYKSQVKEAKINIQKINPILILIPNKNKRNH